MSDYGQGYADARNLIEILGSDYQGVRLAELAEPPAMPSEYRRGFVKAVSDARKRWRPNSNYILAVMRDGEVDWSTAMAWAFACAETLTVLGAEVPAELGYQPSPFVAVESPETYEPESYENSVVWEFSAGYEDIKAVETIQFAARCLSRYIDWCRAAGKDY